MLDFIVRIIMVLALGMTAGAAATRSLTLKSGLVEGLARATIALWSARVLIFQLEHLGEPVTGQNLLTCIPIAVGLTYAVVVTFGQGDGGPVERSR